MSEEVEEKPVAEAAEEQTETPEASEPTEVNPLYDALFNAVEGEEESPEPETEEFEQPSSLQAALYDINNPDSDTPAEPVGEEQEQSEPEQPKSKPKPKVKLKPKVIDPEFSAPTPQRPRREIPATPDDPFVSELNDDERERYELAKWAAANVQGQQELPSQYLKFFKEHKEYINKRLEHDPDHDLGSDEEYRRFVEMSKPKVKVKDLEREKWTQTAEQRALKRMQPEIQRLHLEQRKIQNSPMAAKGFAKSKEMMIEAVPEEMRKELSENSEEYAKRNPFEVNIVNSSLQQGLQLSKAFYDILYELEDYNEQNPVHRALSDFINNEQESFIQSGKTRRNGKTFVRRERFPHVPDAEKSKYYTFTDDDIARMLAQRTKASVEKQLTDMRNQFSQAGYSREGVPAATPAPQTPVVQQNAPKPIQPTQMAGAAMPTSKKEGSSSNSVLSLLDM